MADPKNPTAFPVRIGEDIWSPGMTLRDWFAGQAMAGYLLAMPEDDEASIMEVAEISYMLADAMLSERIKKN